MQKTTSKKTRRVGKAYRKVAKAARLKRMHRKVLKNQKRRQR